MAYKIRLSGNKLGSTTVTARYTDGGVEKTVSGSYSVVQNNDAYVDVSPSAQTLTYNGGGRYLLSDDFDIHGVSAAYVGYKLGSAASSDSEITWYNCMEDNGLTAINAGTYFLYKKWTADSNHSNSQSFVLFGTKTINKADGGVTISNANPTYGSGGALASVSGATGTVYYRLGTSGSFSTTIPTTGSNNAGSYTLYYYVAESTNYNAYGSSSAPKSLTVTIKKATRSGAVSCNNVNCGSTVQASVSGNTESGTVSWGTSNSAIATVNTSGVVTGVAPGTVNITASVAATTNYEAYTATQKQITVNILTGSTGVATTAMSIVYSTTSATRTVSGNTGTVTVSSSNTGVATVAISGSTITVTRAGYGSSTITCSVPATGCYAAASSTFTVTCSKAAGTVTISNANPAYGSGSALASVSGATGTVYYRLGTSGNFGTTVPTTGSNNAGSYTLYYYVAESTNYTAFGSSSSPKSLTVTIKKATRSGSVSCNNVNCGSTVQASVSGNTENGTVTWGTSNSSIATVNTSGVVTGVAPGTVNITASVAATTNYEAYTATQKQITVNALTGATGVSTSGMTITYSATTGTRTVSGNTGTVSVSSSDTSVATVAISGTTITVTRKGYGSATITCSVPATGCYAAASSTFTVSCNKAARSGSVSCNNVNCGSTVQASVSGNTENGAVMWGSSNTSVATVNSSGVVTGVAPGTTNITASVASTTNYEAYTATAKQITVNALTGSTGVSTSAMTITYSDTTGTRTVSGNTGTVTVSSSNSNVATVAISGSTITVTRKGYGSATITVNVAANGCYAANSSTFTVNCNRAARSGAVSCNNVNCGSTVTATVSGNTESGTITWGSSNTSVATVNSSGVVTGVAPGTTNITASVAQTTNYLAYTATQKQITVNALTGATGVSTSAMTITYSATTGTRTVSGNTGTVTVSSSNSNVATVAISGTTITVTRKGYGSATITCNAAASGCYAAASSTFTVTCAKAAITPSVTCANPTYGGGTVQASVSGNSGSGTVTWSSSNTNIATVNSSTGVVTPVAAGSVRITASIAESTNYLSGSAYKDITVNKANITVTVNCANVNCGSTVDASLGSGSNPGSGTVTWSSGNTNVATVNSSTGRVVAVSPGTVRITATVAETTNYLGNSGYKDITVNSLTGSTGVSASAMTITYSATTGTRTVSGNTGTVSVSSSNSNVATVAISGSTITVTRKGYGTATITCSVPATGCYAAASSTFTVTCAKAAITPSVTCDNPTYGGGTVQAMVSGNSGSGTVTWSSSDTSVATVNSSTGVVTPVKAGSTRITATIAESTNYLGGSAYKDITVNKATPTVTVNCSNVTCGSTVQASLGTGSNPGSGDVTWSSSNTNVAIVNSSGVVSGVAYGTVRITASIGATTNYNAASGYKDITVNYKTGSTGVSTSAMTITYSATTATRTVSGNTGAVSVSSTNTSVATVAISGATITVTRQGYGTATITCSVPVTGCYAAATSTFTVSCNKADGGVTISNANPAYGSGGALSSVSGATGTVYYRLGTSGNFGTTVPTTGSNNAGSYTLYYYVAEATNYTAYGSSSSPKSLTVTIKKATRSGSVSCNNVNCGSTVQASVSGNTENGTVTWGTSNSSIATVNTSGVVTGVAPGTVDITASVAATTNYEAYTATKKTITVNILTGLTGVSTSAMTITYSTTTATRTVSGNTGTVSVSSSNTSVAEVAISGTTITVTRKGYGSATITCSVPATGCYAAASSTFTVSCNKAAGGVTISNANATYGSGNNLVSVSGATGTVYYRLGTSGSFGTTIPTTGSNNAGSYTLYYYVAEATNYTAYGSSSSPKSLDVTIKKADGTVTISNANPAYGSGSNLVSVSGATGTVYYRLGTSGSFGTTVPTTGSNNAGSYTLYYYVAEATNYTAFGSSSSPKSLTVTIKKASRSGAVSCNDVNCGSTVQASVSGNTENGTVTWNSLNTSIATVNASGVVTGVAPGTATITAGVAETTNYAGYVPTSKTITVNALTGSTGVSTSSMTITYSPSSSTATRTVSGNTGTVSVSSSNTSVAEVTISGSTITVTRKGYGTATITCSVPATGCYAAATSTFVVVGNKADGGVTITNANPTYNSGNNIATVSGATGTVYYRLGTSGSFSTTMPKASSVDAGSYTLYYYVAESTNYNAFGSSSSPKSVTVTVAKASNQISITPTTQTIYDRSGYNTFTITVTNYKGTVTASSSNTSKATVSKTNNGSFTVTYAGAGTATITLTDSSTNYVTSTATCAVTTKVDTVTNSNYSPSSYTVSVSIGNGLTAGGGSATVTASASHTAYNLYESGWYGESHSVTDSATWTITSQTFTPSGGSASTTSRFSKSSNTLSHDSMTSNVGTDKVIVTATNSSNTSTTATDTKSITNELGAQKYKNTQGTTGYNVIYNNPVCTITNNLTAGGGKITVGCAVSNGTEWYQRYTSGTYTSKQTGSEAGTAKWRITQANNRFLYPTSSDTLVIDNTTCEVYSSNTEVHHSSMTTIVATDTIGVTAYNAGDTSKRSEQQTVSVTNKLESIQITLGAASVACYGTTTASVSATYTSGSSKDVTDSLTTNSSATTNKIYSSPTGYITIS